VNNSLTSHQADLRHRDLLAAAARARLGAHSPKPAPAPAARPIARVVCYARYALASLAAVAFAYTAN
jgi:hypothetical protein